MLLEEMELDGVDAREVDLLGRRRTTGPTFPVVVIGCGQSGLLAGIRLQEAGIPFTIVEKNAGVGRHLVREHATPAAGSTSATTSTATRSSPSDQWSEFFAQPARAAALLRRRDATATASRPTSGGRPRWSAPCWDEDDGRVARCASGPPTATEETLRRPGGHLRRRPAQPAAPARHPGPRHRSPGPRSTRPVGPRASTSPASGSRSSAPGPAASRSRRPSPTEVEHLTVFQRTAQWMFPNPNYHEPVGPGVPVGPAPPALLRALVPLPALLAGLRRRARGRPGRPGLRPDQQRAVSETNEITRQMFTDWITSQVGDEPRPAGQGRARLPRHRQAHAAGQRQLAAAPSPATTSTWSATGIDHIEADAVVTERRRAPRGRRDRLRHRVPRQPLPLADGGRRPGRRGAGRASGATSPRPTSASPCPGSRTCSACTDRAPTWPTAAA